VDRDGDHANDGGDRRHSDHDGADAVKPVLDGGASHVGDLAAKKSVRQHVSGVSERKTGIIVPSGLSRR
jgi:hypothetical protein